MAKFTGPVEADETYIGGKERNKHSSDRLRQERGVVGKRLPYRELVNGE